ncbi:hypothetical protein [Azospirillum brasilense]|uniref:hypothetical protein n=1 Tax=Azospirillum brasilense TaxID=192 RepID=UPI0012DC7F6F|nr:hypothetical protein [Azospirillum brasilense]
MEQVDDTLPVAHFQGKPIRTLPQRTFPPIPPDDAVVDVQRAGRGHDFKRAARHEDAPVHRPHRRVGGVTDQFLHRSLLLTVDQHDRGHREGDERKKRQQRHKGETKAHTRFSQTVDAAHYRQALRRRPQNPPIYHYFQHEMREILEIIK